MESLLRNWCNSPRQAHSGVKQSFSRQPVGIRHGHMQITAGLGPVVAGAEAARNATLKLCRKRISALLARLLRA